MGSGRCVKFSRELASGQRIPPCVINISSMAPYVTKPKGLTASESRFDKSLGLTRTVNYVRVSELADVATSKSLSRARLVVETRCWAIGPQCNVIIRSNFTHERPSTKPYTEVVSSHSKDLLNPIPCAFTSNAGLITEDSPD